MSSIVAGFLVLVLSQTPAPPAAAAPAAVQRVTVGLTNGQQVVLENPEFAGFIQGVGADAILNYRGDGFHGEMPASAISRIDFGKYQRGKPFSLRVMLQNGQSIDVQTEHRNYLIVTGRTDAGIVLVKYPDPISAPLKLSTAPADRHKDLTIQYLVFAAP